MSKKKDKKKRKIKEIKSKKKIIKKESDLEEDIKEGSAESSFEESPAEAGSRAGSLGEAVSLGETEFRKFLNPKKTSVPTLQKILIQEPLKVNMASSLTQDIPEAKEKDYIASSNEPKYTDTPKTSNEENQKKYESDFRPPVLETTKSRNKDSGFIMPAKDVRIETNDDTPRIEMDVLMQKRRNPFEIEEKKYKEMKF